MLSRFALFLLFISLRASGAVEPRATALNLIRNASAPVEARVDALLPLLSEDVKLNQLLRGSNYNPTQFNTTLLASGLGMLEFTSMLSSVKSPSELAALRNAVQSQFLSSGPGKEFGVPVSFRTLATHGSEAFGVVFPQGPALGSTFDTMLVTELSAAMAEENRALGIDLTTFVIHMVADARFGRQEEGFSEEPCLTAAMAAASALGSQGGFHASTDYILPPSAPSLFKHLGAYGAPAGGLNGGRADAHEHTLRDVYLKPWRRAAAVGARGVMPAHNTLLGCPAHGSPWLLSTMIRGEFNQSNALVLSDTGDVSGLARFRLCDGNDGATCAAAALTAGVDIEQPTGTTYLELPGAIARGLATQGDVDAAVRRVLIHKFSSGIFDAPLVNATAADGIVNSAAHRALAQTAAEEGAVLLVNKGGVLPLAHGLRLAVIGPNGGCGESGSGAGVCDVQSAYLGNYAPGPLPLTGVQTVAEAIAQSGLASNVSFARGASINVHNTSLIPAAVALATSGVDAVVLVLGDSTQSCGESIDVDNLDLPGSQLDLLAALAATPNLPPVILVLVNGRSATFGASSGNVLLNSVDALLVAWRPGQMGAAAITNLLFGVANPSGRLPNSWVRSVGQSGAGASPWLAEREGVWGGESAGAEGRRYGSYWSAAGSIDNPTSPLFSFGDGLSYTNFSLDHVAVIVQTTNATVPILATTVVRNVGARDGACVVFVFVQDPPGLGAGRIVRPWKRLVAFKRVVVAANAAVSVALPVDADDLAFYDANNKLAVQKGAYTLSIGQHSTDDADNTETFVI